MSMGCGVNSVRKWIQRTQPSAWHRGSAHQWWPLSRLLLGWDPEGSGAPRTEEAIVGRRVGEGACLGMAVRALAPLAGLSPGSPFFSGVAFILPAWEQ